MWHKYLCSTISSAMVSARCQHNILAPQSFHFHYHPIHFLQFVISNMKVRGEFGFTITHLYLKSSPSASLIDQNICNNCMKDTSLRPPDLYTCSTLYCSVLYWTCGQKLTIRYRQKFQPTFLGLIRKAVCLSTTIIGCFMSKNKGCVFIETVSITLA